MTTHTDNEEIFAQNYIDIQKWISEGGAVGQVFLLFFFSFPKK